MIMRFNKKGVLTSEQISRAEKNPVASIRAEMENYNNEDVSYMKGLLQLQSIKEAIQKNPELFVQLAIPNDALQQKGVFSLENPNVILSKKGCLLVEAILKHTGNEEFVVEHATVDKNNAAKKETVHLDREKVTRLLRAQKKAIEHGFADTDEKKRAYRETYEAPGSTTNPNVIREGEITSESFADALDTCKFHDHKSVTDLFNRLNILALNLVLSAEPNSEEDKKVQATVEGLVTAFMKAVTEKATIFGKKEILGIILKDRYPMNADYVRACFLKEGITLAGKLKEDGIKGQLTALKSHERGLGNAPATKAAHKPKRF